MDKILHKELSYRINGLLFEAHKKLGQFRNEKQYADYFEILLKREGIKYVREYSFDDQEYGRNKIRCICDFIIEDKIILEFKTKNYLTKTDYYQVQRYLATLNLELAILINFRQIRLNLKRILNSKYVKNDNYLD